MPQIIMGVPTSVAAFVGYTTQGTVNEPIQIKSVVEYEANFGPIDPSSEVSYAVDHFFANGGEEAWVTRVVGQADPAQPGEAEIIGSAAAASGLFALDKIDLFNILVVPDRSDAAIHTAMIALAQRKRAFAILDLPLDANTVEKAQAWVSSMGSLQHASAAAYFPRIRAVDAAQGGLVRSFANSGFIAGIFARVDKQRGVWKAPAGNDVSIQGAVGLEAELANRQQQQINPLGLNGLRIFPGYGPVVWGARTLAGADTLASDWKYVPVRRLALFLEESLIRGLQWVKTEPNAEPLWQQVRLTVASFMHGLFRQRAFQGHTANEAYVVRCDQMTTTQANVDAGVLNVAVGFAALKPAEFLWLRLSIAMGE